MSQLEVASEKLFCPIVKFGVSANVFLQPSTPSVVSLLAEAHAAERRRHITKVG